MPALTRAQTVKGGVFTKRKVPMPEFGKDKYVFARTFSVDTMLEGQRMQDALADDDAKSGRAMAGFCVLGLCDAKGARLYTLDDIDALCQWPFSALARCADAVSMINVALTEPAETARKKDSRRRKSSSRSGSRSRKG